MLWEKMHGMISSVSGRIEVSKRGLTLLLVNDGDTELLFDDTDSVC